MKTPVEKSVAGILGLMLGAILLFGFVRVSSVIVAKLCDVRDEIRIFGRP